MKNYVIIGNSIAGTSAVKAIREIDKENKIILISDEKYLNYSRPLISYLLAQKVSSDRLNYLPNDFYQKNNVELLLNKKALKLDIKDKNVLLNDKSKIKYDKLLLATGGTAIIPQISGLDCEGVFNFMKLSDIEKIEKYLKKNKVKKSVVIGAGLIGLKATEALMNINIKVSIIEIADRILPMTFDKQASEIYEELLKIEGCEIILNNSAVEIRQDSKSKVCEVILKDDKKIKTDLVIIATGVRPNIELAQGTEISTNRGFLVDKKMRTNIDDIYAAGDCCEPTIAILPVAAKQGKIAGYNMAGLNKEFQWLISMNSVELCNIPSISAGQTNVSSAENIEILSQLDKEKNVYKKIVIKENKVIGYIFVGSIEKAGIFTMMINDKIDISSFKDSLLNEDFGLINLPKEFRKHLVIGAGIEV